MSSKKERMKAEFTNEPVATAEFSTQAGGAQFTLTDSDGNIHDIGTISRFTGLSGVVGSYTPGLIPEAVVPGDVKKITWGELTITIEDDGEVRAYKDGLLREWILDA